MEDIEILEAFRALSRRRGLTRPRPSAPTRRLYSCPRPTETDQLLRGLRPVFNGVVLWLVLKGGSAASSVGRHA